MEIIINALLRLHEKHKKINFSCRRYQMLLRDEEGIKVGRKRLSKAIAKAGLSLHKNPNKRKPGRKKLTKKCIKMDNLIKDLDIYNLLPYQVLVSDFFHNKIKQEAYYTCFVLDLSTRKCLAHLTSNHATKELLISTLELALKDKPANFPFSVIFHSDNGSQYTTKDFEDYTDLQGIKRSKSAPGTPTENIFAERFVKTVKHELLYGENLSSSEKLVSLLNERINWYNEGRKHQEFNNESTPSTKFEELMEDIKKMIVAKKVS